MHLLSAQPGGISDGSEAVDLGQTPADVVVLSAADTELACLAKAQNGLLKEQDNVPSLRLANLLNLGHNMSVDLYLDDIIQHAKIVVVRLLGGHGYWPYGVDQIAGLCRDKKIPVAFLPGDDQPDQELDSFSTLAADARHRLWQYCVQGGMDNAAAFLKFTASLIGYTTDWTEPRPLLRSGIYWPGIGNPSLNDLKDRWQESAPTAAIIFYRALVQAGNIRVIDGLIDALQEEGLNPLPIYVASLKDQVVTATVETLLADGKASVILNGTGFALSSPGAARTPTPFDASDCPVIQMVFSGGNRQAWEDGTFGLSARDIAMNVALPEVDGRILSRAVSFKGSAIRDEQTQIDIIEYDPVPDRLRFTAQLAKGWASLRQKENKTRRVGLVLANYPNRDGRIGNGVGLDTPAGSVTVLRALQDAGYRVEDVPEDGNALIERLQEGPTNQATDGRVINETLGFNDYQIFFSSLPQAVQNQVTERWGKPEDDPFYMAGDLDCGRFAISAFRAGHIAVCLQPARGYNIDPEKTYHDPDLVPPHGYLAFYAWLRFDFKADAIVHMGKHGNLEWLPGKSLALSSACFPEAVFGSVPHLYPFIVNDPGEGTQAKRRTSAVIIDHLTPPLTRAESYGPLKDLEQLVDEYYEASGVDPRRLKVLKKEILSLCAVTGLDSDCGIHKEDDEETALGKLDNYLCELKEMQIRDGLHIFGETPKGRLLTDLLVALLRVPRNKGEGGDASLLRALSEDLQLGFDPLDCDFAKPWEGPFPEILAGDAPWRTQGDTVERLEDLSGKLVTGDLDCQDNWRATAAVLDHLNDKIRPAVEACGAAEINGLLKGLDGRFVEPGPSGAPTRGRPDVLPTGKNFYSVDTRTVPTPAAWTLGWKSATLLVERYMQDHGDWPKTMALTAWGTSNMRTGGDDIAQGLALMGVRPTWDSASRRITGFEVLPLSVLDRPRVDVTLRISGFFRDAFPGLIDLFDSAARAVAALDEPADQNPLAARVQEEVEQMMAKGLDEKTAIRRSCFRVFGSMPGAYGAGLQALIDEKGWQTEDDLAAAYIAWGGFAYGDGAEGEDRKDLFKARLSSVEAIVQNQDNREHDLLDSDDYYQFEGGMTAAVRSLTGKQPAVFHNDHSRPETPKIKTLEEEITRVVRARVVNPKWIEGVMRHGYKGAFEMAATVDYLFAFAATANCVANHHFDMVFQAFLEDEAVLNFLKENNQAALKEMIDRFKEAQMRGLWQTRLNSTQATLEELSGTLS